MMVPKRALHAGAALTAALALSGCVAAVVPVIAGGALATTQIDGDKPGEPKETETFDIVSDFEEVAKLGEPAPLEPKVTVRNFSDAEMSEKIGLFSTYVEQTVTANAEAKTLQSAMLRDPGALDGVRRNCTDKPAAVLIDLDPAGKLFAPDSVRSANRQLAPALEKMRSEGIAIGWISGLSATDVSAIRRILGLTGLDPEGEDALLLLRYPDDRKQSRREEFAQEHCVIAIAGDTRSDFDELYDFIREPSAASALEPMYDKGWFMTPLPLTE